MCHPGARCSIAVCSAVLVLLGWDGAFAFLSNSPGYRRSDRSRGRVATSHRFTSLHMAYKLWERLEIEEDEEPNWYLLNCVATNEIDLLRQCRTICEDMTDVVKFVVPIEQLTRSHGASKMVTETKVKYPGYVFAKLRLSPVPYEAIQDLDLCRSWMGTVNRKGHKKLPPIPLALGEEEVESFGLEDVPVESDEVEPTDPEAVIMDSEEDDDDDYSYEDPMYKNIDKKALKKFKGLKVEDMVKVTAQGKFLNEDGIVRRLKDGKIFVRFYTYGTMFEEWMDPSDLRKLSSEEILKGLSGPSQPITQRDFDGPDEMSSVGDRRNAGSNIKTAFGGDQRNRRQDRVVDRFRSPADTQQRDEKRNWDWYKEQQQQKQGRPTYSDAEWRMQPGSERSNAQNSNGRWAEGDADSQWGRKPERQERKEVRKTTNQVTNRRTAAAIDGRDDWSTFVSSSTKVETRTNAKETSAIPETVADDFFASLMNDLNKDLGSTAGRQQQPSPTKESSSSEDDFFASLMTELSYEAPMSKEDSYKSTKQRSVDPPRQNDSPTISQDDDFFAFLEADLEKALGDSLNGDNGVDIDGTDYAAPISAETSRSKEPSPLKAKSEVVGVTSASDTSQQGNPGDLAKKTVPVLKEMLRERGLKVGGTKAELVERLLQQS